VAGLRLRAAAMLVVSVGVVVFAAVAAILAGASPGSVAVLTISSLFAFQAAYLVGVTLGVFWSRRQDAKGRGGSRPRL
jgi:Na+/proline symporter